MSGSSASEYYYAFADPDDPTPAVREFMIQEFGACDRCGGPLHNKPRRGGTYYVSELDATFCSEYCAQEAVNAFEEDNEDDHYAEEEGEDDLEDDTDSRVASTKTASTRLTPRRWGTFGLRAAQRHGLITRRIKDASLSSPRNIEWFATAILRDRWPEGEAALVKSGNVEQMYSYYIALCGDPSWGDSGGYREGVWPEAESAFARIPKYLLAFSDAMSARFKAGEPTLANQSDSYMLKRYMENHGPLDQPLRDEVEKRFFLTDPKEADFYAEAVLRGPWVGPNKEAAEDAIATDSYCSYTYVTNCLRARFEKGEPVLQADDMRWGWYQDFLKDLNKTVKKKRSNGTEYGHSWVIASSDKTAAQVTAPDVQGLVAPFDQFMSVVTSGKRTTCSLLGASGQRLSLVGVPLGDGTMKFVESMGRKVTTQILSLEKIDGSAMAKWIGSKFKTQIFPAQVSVGEETTPFPPKFTAGQIASGALARALPKTDDTSYLMWFLHEWAKQHYRVVGTGSSRIAYKLDEVHALKLAFNGAGIAQNLQESRVAQDMSDLPITNIHYVSPEGAVMVVDFAHELNVISFRKDFGISFDDYADTIDEYMTYPDERKHLIGQLPAKAQKLFASMIHHHLSLPDLKFPNQWGDLLGHAVLVDFGLTKEVWIKHYKAGSSKNAKASLPRFMGHRVLGGLHQFDFLNARILKAVSTNWFYAIQYARDILKDRWVAGEKAIMQDAFEAYSYARWILQGPWPEAEPVIAANFTTAYNYATRILGLEPVAARDWRDKFKDENVSSQVKAKLFSRGIIAGGEQNARREETNHQAFSSKSRVTGAADDGGRDSRIDPASHRAVGTTRVGRAGSRLRKVGSTEVNARWSLRSEAVWLKLRSLCLVEPEAVYNRVGALTCITATSSSVVVLAVWNHSHRVWDVYVGGVGQAPRTSGIIADGERNARREESSRKTVSVQSGVLGAANDGRGHRGTGSLLRRYGYQDGAFDGTGPQQVHSAQVGPPVPEVKKIRSLRTEEGVFSVWDIDATHRRPDMFTVWESKDGWIVRNVLIPEELQRMGIASKTYRTLNQLSLKATGKPLRSTQERTLMNGQQVLELSGQGRGLWDSLVGKGMAERVGDTYKFKTSAEGYTEDDLADWKEILDEETFDIPGTLVEQMVKANNLHFEWKLNKNILILNGDTYLSYTKIDHTFYYIKNIASWVADLSDSEVYDLVGEPDDIYNDHVGASLNDYRKSPGVVYHYTSEAAWESIKQDGYLNGSSGTGRTNRYVSGVFTTTDSEELEDGVYGDVLLEIDLPRLLRDHPDTRLSFEPEVEECLSRQMVVGALGLEDQINMEPDNSGGMSYSTVIIGAAIPVGYIYREGEGSKVAAKAAKLFTRGIIAGGDSDVRREEANHQTVSSQSGVLGAGHHRGSTSLFDHVGRWNCGADTRDTRKSRTGSSEATTVWTLDARKVVQKLQNLVGSEVELIYDTQGKWSGFLCESPTVVVVVLMMPGSSGWNVYVGLVSTKPKTADQTVYHGSPHVFDGFSTDHIGNGEGNQTYGWGLYFTSSEAIAKHYREELKGGKAHIHREVDSSLIHAAQSFLDSGVTPTVELLQKSYPKANKVHLQYAIDEVTGVNAGSLYEVKIPDDSEFLLWDRPLSAQPQKVQDLFHKILNEGRENNPMTIQDREKSGGILTGEQAYRKLGVKLVGEWVASGSRTKADKAASLYLLSLGIKGIKYLDGNSRSAGNGTYNYVVFDGKDTKVVKKAKLFKMKTAHPAQWDTPEFKRWFAGSKIVDDRGNPLRLYHGTTTGPANEEYFSTGQGGYIYVAPDPTYTENYNYGQGGKTFALYAKATRPFDLRKFGSSVLHRDLLKARLSDAGVDISPFKDESGLYKPIYQWVKLPGFKEALEDAGFDAIWLRESAGGGEGDALLLFDTRQLKSAIGNRGTYDGDDPRITASKTAASTLDPSTIKYGFSGGGVIVLLLRHKMFNRTLESAIASNPRCAYSYARVTLKDRWPVGEAAIASDSKYANLYAQNVLNYNRWDGPHAHAAERTLATAGPRFTYRAVEYAKDCIKHRWDGPYADTTEAEIAKDPILAFLYARDSIGGRWTGPSAQVAETSIATTAAQASYYSVYVMKHAWDGPAAERALSSINEDTYYSNFYESKIKSLTAKAI